MQSCSHCNGQGQVAFQQGFFTIGRSCGHCRGTGNRVSKRCERCGGEGLERVEREIKLRIPAGVDDGMQLQVRGEGEAGSIGAPRGELYVAIHVREHPIFTRDGRDVLSTAEISFSQAALGANCKVPTLSGEHNLKIPAGSQSGTRFRLKGRGVPDLDGRGRGDHYIRVQVRTPVSLDERQREVFERLAEIEELDSEDRGLFDRVKDIFS